MSRLLKRLSDLSRSDRRRWMQLSAAGVLGGSMSGWLEALAAASNPAKRRGSCILLWMNGGPSQMDTFDLKPGTDNGGSFKDIDTTVSGVKISEHLPRLATHASDMAIIRSMTTKEGDHGRATTLVRTGYLPVGAIRYPTLGSLVAKELGHDDAELPNFVSIAPFRSLAPAAYGPGFLGPNYAPLVVGDGPSGGEGNSPVALKVENLALPDTVSPDSVDGRLSLLTAQNNRFIRERPAAAPHDVAYGRAVRLMRSAAAKAFELGEETDATRERYGKSKFGQGCLLARRLVERGVPFVEVTLSGVDNQVLGWDTHADNFETVKKLSGVLDPAWSALLDDLRAGGLLDSTMVVWMGEFGRTPKINPGGGRDHFPNAWSAVLAGGGIRGGQAIGRTSADGTTIEDRPVAVPDLLATICQALDIDPAKQNISNTGRPIGIVDSKAQPLAEIL
ncbi:MAG TPA: DUF1501 domain-containing protein [Pirellulales bacterium]|jgi:hypothetical protein